MPVLLERKKEGRGIRVKVSHDNTLKSKQEHFQLSARQYTLGVNGIQEAVSSILSTTRNFKGLRLIAVSLFRFGTHRVPTEKKEI